MSHYHVVFTVPDHLNVLCLHNGRMFYNLLFSAVWHTLNSFGYSHYGVGTGAIAVLHTWGQNLSLHPHIHCLVPAAGYSLDGRWKNDQLILIPCHCPMCKTGQMIRIRKLPPIRSPPGATCKQTHPQL